MILFACICPNGCRYVSARIDIAPLVHSCQRCGAERVLHRIELSDLTVQADESRLGGPVETEPRSILPGVAPSEAAAQGAERGGNSSVPSPHGDAVPTADRASTEGEAEARGRSATSSHLFETATVLADRPDERLKRHAHQMAEAYGDG